MNAPNQGALPAHSVRVSKRARRISLRVLPGKGLEVVLPRNADPVLIPELLRRNRAWIERAFRRMNIGAPALDDNGFPRLLRLKGGAEEVEVRLRGETGPEDAEKRTSPLPGAGQGICGQLPPRRVLTLPDTDPAAALKRLRAWLREESRAYFAALLAEISEKHGLPYSALSIRFQRSRWGSCSAKGGISLNAALLFLPERLIRYIAAHELCHTRQMNHSQAFWKLLFSVEPDALALDKGMRRAWRYVPDWVLR